MLYHWATSPKFHLFNCHKWQRLDTSFLTHLSLLRWGWNSNPRVGYPIRFCRPLPSATRPPHHIICFPFVYFFCGKRGTWTLTTILQGLCASQLHYASHCFAITFSLYYKCFQIPNIKPKKIRHNFRFSRLSRLTSWIYVVFNLNSLYVYAII